jgi:hypothetical protein
MTGSRWALPVMSEGLAASFARTALANIRQEYPNKLDHVMNDASDVCPPRRLHPVFYGSFDWHSSVHMHWLLAHLLRRYPQSNQSAAIAATFDEHLTPQNVVTELAYLNQPSRESFERTYGWSWLLKLQTELFMLGQDLPAARIWHQALQPLADAFVGRFQHFLPLTQFPIRAGTHTNSAFALYLALDYAICTRHAALDELIRNKAYDWFAHDRNYPSEYELGSEDFLSGGLMEAALMLRILGGQRFPQWWENFCPQEKFQTWLVPVHVGCRLDPKLAHLDGLNLSRAWCLRNLLKFLPEPHQQRVAHAIRAHLEASLPSTCEGDYVSTHWLASFALLGLGEK